MRRSFVLESQKLAEQILSRRAKPRFRIKYNHFHVLHRALLKELARDFGCFRQPSKFTQLFLSGDHKKCILSISFNKLAEEHIKNFLLV